MEKQRLTILGSTGSIGVQTLDIVRENPDRFEVTSLTAHKNWQLLAEQAIAFDVDSVVIGDEQYYKPLSEALANYPIKVFAGDDSIAAVASAGNCDTVVNALVGYDIKPQVSNRTRCEFFDIHLQHPAILRTCKFCRRITLFAQRQTILFASRRLLTIAIEYQVGTRARCTVSARSQKLCASLTLPRLGKFPLRVQTLAICRHCADNLHHRNGQDNQKLFHNRYLCFTFCIRFHTKSLTKLEKIYPKVQHFDRFYYRQMS